MIIYSIIMKKTDKKGSANLRPNLGKLGHLGGSGEEIQKKKSKEKYVLEISRPLRKWVQGNYSGWLCDAHQRNPVNRHRE